MRDYSHADLDERSEFEILVERDAYEVARRTLAHDFRYLANDRIIGILRPLATAHPELERLSNAQLLDRWFASYSDAVELLRISRDGVAP
jgi:hypothetical protein